MEQSTEAEPIPPDGDDIAVQDLAPQWLIDSRRSPHRYGFYHALGQHALQFTDRGNERLVISFDNLSSAREDAIARDPWGYGFVAKNGWSQLGVLAFTPSWFRDKELINALERLAGMGFFKRFKSITMTGTSMGGYAACAFSALAPGCNVVAFSPQSTLNSDLVPWEYRFQAARKVDWNGKYADATQHVGQADKVWLIYDPNLEDDRQHIDRFTGGNIYRLKARRSGHKTALTLRRANILGSIVSAAVRGDLTTAGFYNQYRNVRHARWYIDDLTDNALSRKHYDAVARLIPYLRGKDLAFLAHQIKLKYIEATGRPPIVAPSFASPSSSTETEK